MNLPDEVETKLRDREAIVLPRVAPGKEGTDDHSLPLEWGKPSVRQLSRTHLRHMLIGSVPWLIV